MNDLLEIKAKPTLYEQNNFVYLIIEEPIGILRDKNKVAFKRKRVKNYLKKRSEGKEELKELDYYYCYYSGNYRRRCEKYDIQFY